MESQQAHLESAGLEIAYQNEQVTEYRTINP
jgi:hypothetical protein